MLSRCRLITSSRFCAAVLISALILIAAVHVRAGGAQAAAPSTLTIGWAEDSTNLDPTGTISNPNAWVTFNIYDQLLRVGNDGTTLNPDLATSWDITNGGTVYTFHLRHNVVFSNGQPLTAADVKFCLDRARGAKAAWSWTLTAIKTITTPNADTVRVTLSHPWSPFLSDVALYDTGIYPQSYFQRVGASGLAAHPIGTGPYMLQSWKRGQYLILQKNPRYWAANQFPLQSIEFEVIPNDSTRLLKVEAGQLDVDNVLPASLIAQARRNSAVVVQVSPSTEIKYLKGNDALPQFRDLKVRQAIDHAIDRAALVKAVLLGYGTPANSFIPKGAVDWDPNIPVPSYDLTLAKKLMQQSSYPHGFSMPYEVQAGDQEYTTIATIVQSELAPLGIKLTLKPTDPTTLQSIEQADHFHFMGTLWTNDIPDPDELVSFAVDDTQSSHDFYTWYTNAQLTNLSHQAERINDPATRRNLYYSIQQIWAQQTPFFALYYEPFINAVSSRVTGFHQNPLGYFVLQGVHTS